MAWDDQGVLHVANMKPRRGNTWHPVFGRQSTVLALPDKDGDGRADTVYKAADDLNWPHSIAFYQGALFVADDDAIYRLEDQDADGFYEERAVFAEVPGFMGLAYEHVTHTLVFDESNDKLYFHIGAGCDICREDDPERSAIIQMNTDGTGRRILPLGCAMPSASPCTQSPANCGVPTLDTTARVEIGHRSGSPPSATAASMAGRWLTGTKSGPISPFAPTEGQSSR